ncbi:MAG: valine--tRNA ligase [Bryobacteraceae bacterium]
MEIEKVYEPQRFEPHWAKWWVESNLFHVEAPPPGTDYFSLVIPPPNVTGSLHMGHMFEHSIIDAQVRWQRMCGKVTLWVPGTDHAGIATQIMVERQLATEGLTRHNLGREKFEERVWKWKEEYGGKIVDQMKRAGVSCDWSRARFTLDPGLSRAVREAFVRLYEKGLIYRGQYMVNWCPRCQTAVSDLEVEHEETQGNLWHIIYPVIGSDLKLVVATTRPETMLGDTAVAINPADKRAAELRGKKVRLPLTNREIPIVLDDMADPEFGSGAVKITPAHDPNDFEAGKRHDLPSIKVIDENAKMTAAAGRFAGLDRFEARKQVVAELEQLGLLEKIEPHKLSIAKCHRCRTIVEPLVSTQWWVKIKPLAEPAIKAVEEGRIEFVPANWSKTYFEWMYNIRDWCISRQLWWGHRIPAWHCPDCKQITVARETPSACSHCGKANITQETDVLDTWFSSGLWPFSTLGWPDDTADLRAFYPTTLLVTGFDIIFFWAARMMMLGIEMMGDVPFRQVHIHGLVRDAERQKMSKTKGNTIDPLVINEKYGTDAVRFALLISAAPGGDIALSEDRIASCRNFANKIWNASRLLFSKSREGAGEPVSLADRWIASRLNACANVVNPSFEEHRYHEAAQALWHFFWDDFCDWYLELKKPDTDWSYAYVVYEKALRLLHPLMPFITEELWQRLGNRGKSIALESYPQAGHTDHQAEREMTLLQDIVTAARALRADHKIDKKPLLTGVLYSKAALNIDAIERLANVKLTVETGAAPKLEGAVRSSPDFDLALEMPKAANQRERLLKENLELEKVIANSDRQLSNEEILSKMPEKVVETLRAKNVAYKAQLQKNLDALANE